LLILVVGFGLRLWLHQIELANQSVVSNQPQTSTKVTADIVPDPLTEAVSDQNTPLIPDQPEPVKEEKPTTVQWDAPFTTQAPRTNWDAFHEEMCEEASLLIADEWYQGATRTKIPIDEAETRLTAMAVWEREALGTDVSTTIQQMAQTATGYLNIPADRVTVTEVKSIDELRELVRKGVVVAPFAGRLLGNPHYTGEGPRYHASVIIGFDERQFVVHDVGTRHGADYQYKNTVLWTALHDYVAEPADITTGSKTVLLLTRP